MTGSQGHLQCYHSIEIIQLLFIYHSNYASSLYHFQHVTFKKLAPYGTNSRFFTTDVSASFKVTRHKN